jgi:hypothetical protein
MCRAVKRRIIGGPFEGSSQHLHTGNEENDEDFKSNLARDKVSTTDSPLR